jgi:hypothetical protein
MDVLVKTRLSSCVELVVLNNWDVPLDVYIRSGFCSVQPDNDGTQTCHLRYLMFVIQLVTHL